MIESGKRVDPRGTTIQRIAEAFGMSVEALTTPPDDPPGLAEFLASDLRPDDLTPDEERLLRAARPILKSQPNVRTYLRLLDFIRSEAERK